LRGTVPAGQYPFLTNPAMVSGTYENGVLTLWVRDDFTRTMLNVPAVTDPVGGAAALRFGQPVRVSVVVGTPPVQAGGTDAPAGEEHDNLDDLLAFGEQFDNITIQ
jgi:DNA polymerase-3 subunit gamma/tau